MKAFPDRSLFKHLESMIVFRNFRIDSRTPSMAPFLRFRPIDRQMPRGLWTIRPLRSAVPRTPGGRGSVGVVVNCSALHKERCILFSSPGYLIHFIPRISSIDSSGTFDQVHGHMGTWVQQVHR